MRAPVWASMTAAALLAALATLATLATGCGSGGDGSGKTVALPIPLTNYCSTVADDVCNRVVPCCTAAGFGSDLATCKAQESAACDARVAAAQKSGLVYDAQAAGTCLASSGIFFDGCAATTLTHWAEMPAQEACTHVFVGRAQTGDRCGADADCAAIAGARVGCSKSGGAVTGTCVKIPLAKIGSACSLTPDAPFVDCEDGAECVTPPGRSSICRGPVPQNAPCGPDTGSCADGLACDGIQQKCLPPAGPGEACSRPCAKDLVCTYAGSDGSSTCQPLPVKGEKCSGQCAGSARCILGVCDDPHAIDAPCNNPSDCASGFCDYKYYAGTPKCAAPPPGYVPYLYVPGVDATTCLRNTPKSG